MANNKISWETNPKKYSNSLIGKAGKWELFEIVYDCFQPRDDPLIYKLKCFLPGIKSDLGNFKERDPAKIKSEEVFEYWINNLNYDWKQGKELIGEEN